MTAGAKLPWQVASAVCVRGLQVAVASCDRCMCGIMAGCYRNLHSPYVRGLRFRPKEPMAASAESSIGLTTKIIRVINRYFIISYQAFLIILHFFSFRP